jgi:signal peptide peptidase SppA
MTQNPNQPLSEAHIDLDVSAVAALYPRVHDYFGAWAILPSTFLAAVEHVKTIDMLSHVKASAGGDDYIGRSYAVQNGVAVIEMAGTLMKARSSVEASSSTVELRHQVRKAASDPSVDAIVLRIDSPGGTVHGTGDLAAEVAAAARQKEVIAYVEDLGASAAYWIASQATKIYTNPTGMVGSIGTFTVLTDSSEYAEKQGVRVEVIRAGAHKGMGTPGTKITDEQKAEVQGNIDALNEHFLQGVSQGRGLTMARVRELNDGKVYVGADAQRAGLVDGIQSFEETLSQLSSRGVPSMAAQSADPAAPVAATINDLKQACPGAGSDFLLAQLEAGATVPVAMKAWMLEQQAQVKAANEAAATAKAEAEAAKKRPGNPVALGSGKKKNRFLADDSDKGDGDKDDDDDDMSLDGNCTPEQFGAEIRAHMKSTQCTQAEAVRVVAKRNPEAHMAYLLATNPPAAHAAIRARFRNN